MTSDQQPVLYSQRRTAIAAAGEVEDIEDEGRRPVPRNELRNRRLSQRTRTPASRQKDVRTEAQRDVDRITYSTAWRRLAGVTQVVTPFSDRPLIHNRLTHSQKVAQVARSAAEVLLNDPKYDHKLIAELGGLDVDVCVAAAMAHDIGHPPFGHVGEEILDEIARAEPKQGETSALRAALGLGDGFEGNAQSIRIVIKGQIRSTDYQGLDLTYATLAAIAKYPWCRETTLAEAEHIAAIDPFTQRGPERAKKDADYRRRWRKFNFYQEHTDVKDRVRQFALGLIGSETQTLEASIMDMADDISYSIHDLEDFLLMGGLLNTSAIRSELNEYGDLEAEATRDPKKFDALKYKGRLGALSKRLDLDYAGWFDPYMMCVTAAELANSAKSVFAKNLDANRDAAIHTWATNQVEHFLQGLELSKDPLWNNGPYISLSKEAWHEVQLLKFITKTYVIQHPDMALLQRGQESILKELFQMLVAWSENDRKRLPERLRLDMETSERINADPDLAGFSRGHWAHGPKVNRAFVDYICSLTDEECTSVFRKLRGIAVHHPFGYSGF